MRGHPLHPPLTDATIGMFTLAAGLGVIGSLGWIDDAAGKGMWLALVGGLVTGVATATTGFLDLAQDQLVDAAAPHRPIHGILHAVATVLFLFAAILQYGGFHDGAVTAGGLALTLLGFAALALGGWLGGTLVFVHGMRVENLSTRPRRRLRLPGPASKIARKLHRTFTESSSNSPKRGHPLFGSGRIDRYRTRWQPRLMSTAHLQTHTDTELEVVEQWRLEALGRAGYDSEAAAVLAASHDVDLHRAIELLERGCPPDLALQILL